MTLAPPRSQKRSSLRLCTNGDGACSRNGIRRVIKRHGRSPAFDVREATRLRSPVVARDAFPASKAELHIS